MNMAEGVAGVVGNAMITALFKPNPSASILKFWQGIVEIALRVGSLVLVFILFICSCVALSKLSPYRQYASLNTILSNTNAAAGWLLFMAIVAMIVEGLILACRFLNLEFINKFGTIVHIVDIVISFGIAAAIFCGAVAIGVYSGTWNTRFKGITDSAFKTFVGALGATSAFGFFSLFVFVGLGVFMILSMVFKWGNTSNYSSPYASGEGDKAGAE